MSDSKQAVCVIVPVYNHPEKLSWLVERFCHLQLPVILVDDGSDAPCHQLMQQLRDDFPSVTLQVHERNQGKGAAIKTGLRAARQAGFSHALQIDADGQHDLDDLPRFIAAMERAPDALIAGFPRYDESIPKHRYYGRYATHVWVWINTLSKSIRDSMCGYRIYPVDASCRLLDRQKMGDRMDFDGEFIVRWYWTGQPLEQLETRVIYHQQGVSHFRLVHDNSLISWMHARLFFGMLLRLPVLLRRRWRAP